uniref:NADH dehydrogenase subunit 3 n=1 Tax=Carebara diversa TaxID=615681 RepID=UPI001EE1484D|nr:NADH dehydrogenase subunit 3 [Carebara diversa]UIO59237.1 NADH dehydrogenase subunit 3 [Carebara diversa]
MLQLPIILMPFFFIPALLLFLNLIISKKSFNDREKMSPFECGFDPLTNARPPFSVHFFIISLIFLIFDIEISLLIPLVFMMYTFNIPFLLTLLIFLLILIIGLFIEYSEQSIDWKI